MPSNEKQAALKGSFRLYAHWFSSRRGPHLRSRL